MTVILHLKPEVEAGLSARAHASGMDLEEYILWLAEQASLQTAQSCAAETAREEAVRRMIEFGDKHHLSLDESITRDFLHEGHRH